MDNKLDFNQILWDMSGIEIEEESFRRLEAEANKSGFLEEEWPIARRLIHTTADFSIADTLTFNNDPINACINALKKGALLYSDSNMIKSGISVAKLKKMNDSYSKESIKCFIADPDVAEIAKDKHCSRALASVSKAESILAGSIVLIGNAPLALAGIIKLYSEKGIKPAMIIGMPVGFVNVVESKNLLMQTDIPHITIAGRRGGSPLAVATLHAIIEKFL